jgi:hypothetical protein
MTGLGGAGDLRGGVQWHRPGELASSLFVLSLVETGSDATGVLWWQVGLSSKAPVVQGLIYPDVKDCPPVPAVWAETAIGLAQATPVMANANFT